jgi:hypothetical protein
MRTVSEDKIAAALAALPGTPRVVASGNAAAPLHTLGVVDRALGTWRLHMFNALLGIPDRGEPRAGRRLIHRTPRIGALRPAATGPVPLLAAGSGPDDRGVTPPT